MGALQPVARKVRRALTIRAARILGRDRERWSPRPREDCARRSVVHVEHARACSIHRTPQADDPPRPLRAHTSFDRPDSCLPSGTHTECNMSTKTGPGGPSRRDPCAGSVQRCRSCGLCTVFFLWRVLLVRQFSGVFLLALGSAPILAGLVFAHELLAHKLEYGVATAFWALLYNLTFGSNRGHRVHWLSICGFAAAELLVFPNDFVHPGAPTVSACGSVIAIF